MLGIQEIVFVLLILVIPVLVIISAVWVYRDAEEKRNSNAAIWAVGTVLAWPLVLILYLVIRPDFRNQGGPTFQ